MTGFPRGELVHEDLITPQYSACLLSMVNRCAIEETRMSHPFGPTPVVLQQWSTGPWGPQMDPRAQPLVTQGDAIGTAT